MDIWNNRPGTINVRVEEDLIFSWEVEIPPVYWAVSGITAGVKLCECIFECKNENGKWEDSRAFLYDPCNPRDSYLIDPRRYEIFAEKEFGIIRHREEGKEIKMRIRMTTKANYF